MKKLFNQKIFFTLILFFIFLLITSKASFAEGIIITSQTYNKSFIDSYIDVEQSPFEAFEKIVDYYHGQNPDEFTFSSEDLPSYALLISGYGHENAGDEDFTTKYVFVYTSTPLVNDVSTTNNGNWAFSIPEGTKNLICTVNDYGLNFETDTIEVSDGGLFYPEEVVGFYAGSYGLSIKASNYDVMSEDGLSTVFQQPTLGKVTTLAPVMNKVEMSPVLKEIITILPLIIVVVVSLVGLRKVLKMLSHLLHLS